MNGDPDTDLLAAELALGLLSPDERRAAEARLAHDPAFAEAHRRWLALAEAWLDAPETPPPAATWTAIAARLPANDTGVLRRWRLATLAASVAALALGGALVAERRRPPAPAPARQIAEAPLVAMLGGEGRASVAIWVDRASGHMTSVPARLHVGDHSPELWVIPTGGKPRSLGVIAEQTGPVRSPAAALPLLRPGATLAISVEPRGGSQTGQPTGPVILTGTLAPA